MSWELRYQEELRPLIERYVNEKSSSFTSSDIAELSDDLSASEIGKILRFADIETILKTGNNPASWECVYTHFEGDKYVIEPEFYEPNGEKTREDSVGMALESLENPNIGRLYSFFRNQLGIKNDEKISRHISEYKKRA